MTKSILWMSVLVLAIAGLSGCSSSDDGYGIIDTIAPATPLQKAFYMAEDDSRQPAWLQEKIKSNPYLKVYHSSKDSGHYLLEYPSSVVFKYMLAQDAVISRMSRSQLRSMLDLCMRNSQIEQSDSEMWSGVNVEATWYVYAKVIYNKGGFAFKDDREKRMFDTYIEHPQFYVFEEDGEIYYLFNEDFMERVLKYVEAF